MQPARRTNHLKLAPTPPTDKSGQAQMPSRRLRNGSIFFGIVEDQPPPYLAVVCCETSRQPAVRSLSGNK